VNVAWISLAFLFVASCDNSTAPRSGNPDSYTERHALFERGGIPSTDAFTMGTPPRDRKLRVSWFADPSHWLPGRVAFHDQLVKDAVAGAVALSKQLGFREPTVVAMRGNTGVGKSTGARNLPDLAHAAAGLDAGAINPDTLKSRIMKDANDRVASKDTHEEGRMLADRVRHTLMDMPGVSLVIDERLIHPSAVDRLIAEVKRTGRKLKFLDVDAPLEMSLVRVLAREPGNDRGNPLVPPAEVREGFESGRTHRAALIDEAIKPGSPITEYALFAAGPDGNQVKVAETKGGKLEILHEDLYRAVTDVKAVRAEADRAMQQPIDEAFIDRALAMVSEKTRPYLKAELERFKGKSLQDAVEAHSKKKKGE
jgi:hypothetical protein